LCVFILSNQTSGLFNAYIPWNIEASSIFSQVVSWTVHNCLILSPAIRYGVLIIMIAILGLAQYYEYNAAPQRIRDFVVAVYVWTVLVVQLEQMVCSRPMLMFV